MYDVTKMNIWKNTPAKVSPDEYLQMDISELGLGVRSYNCLKRSGCNNIADVIEIMESEKGLMSIRNLGKTSYSEITEKIEAYKEMFAKNRPVTEPTTRKTVIKPARKVWDMEVAEFGLSSYSRTRLKNCGVSYVRDLYTKELKQEPGWFAVRELFEKIPI